jgi:hypothetical protein
MRQPTIHQMREKKKSSRKSRGSRKVTILIRTRFQQKVVLLSLTIQPPIRTFSFSFYKIRPPSGVPTINL